ncbi:hypothetical protein [Bradyrhizobium sp. Leo121]|uniref:hypothetical protein n=1 Tax=Bradyrhizobium sp. Leo121 TaxID=1571195 RepID=UPI00102A36BA|nr:hypothetical protein [Bradyrhizobium sp. Leo121]RZN35697.1 hypothetical protein CWO90_02345 [Bradyrhizobium sp. Leo121]
MSENTAPATGKNVQLSADGGTTQWGPYVLDRLVAPKCSDLTACLAPELPEPSNYYASFYLNNVFVVGVPDKVRSPIIVFLRRLANAVRDYRAGRERMLECVAALRHSNAMVQGYLAALSHFESTIVNTYLALMSHEAIGRLMDPHFPKPFQSGDGSPPQRLNAAYNALKHFNGNIERGIIPDGTTPVWLLDDGIESVGSQGQAKLRFEELVELLRDLERDARYLSEDVYRLARERSQAAGEKLDAVPPAAD